MEDVTENSEQITQSKVSAVRIIRKSAPLMLMNGISIGGEFLNTYLLSDKGHNALGASTLIFSTNNFIVDSLTMLPNQSAAFIAELFGQMQELKKLPNKELEIEELSRRIGIVLRQGWILGVAASLPGMAILFSIKPLLGVLGQSSEICELVNQYFLPAAFAMPLQSILNINERLFPSVNLEAWLLPYKILLTAAGIGLNIFLIPRYGMYGAGIALVGKTLTGVVMTKLLMALKNELKQFSIFTPTLALKELPYYKKIFKQGLPITFAQIGVNGGGFGISIAIGHLGNLRLAIEKVAIQYFGIITTVAHGINDATYRIVGQTIGAKEYELTRRYGNIGTIASAGFYSLCAIGANVFALQLASFFLGDSAADNETLIRYSFILVTVGKLFEVILESNTLNLAALQDTFLASATTFVSTIAFILPTSLLLAYLTDLDIYGIAATIAGGLLLSSSATSFYWHKQSSLAIKNNHFDTEKDTSNAKFSKIIRCIPFYKREPDSVVSAPSPSVVENESLIKHEKH
jgi:Na+-driven multidrug efflux pump